MKFKIPVTGRPGDIVVIDEPFGDPLSVQLCLPEQLCGEVVLPKRWFSEEFLAMFPHAAKPEKPAPIPPRSKEMQEAFDRAGDAMHGGKRVPEMVRRVAMAFYSGCHDAPDAEQVWNALTAREQDVLVKGTMAALTELRAFNLDMSAIEIAEHVWPEMIAGALGKMVDRPMPDAPIDWQAKFRSHGMTNTEAEHAMIYTRMSPVERECHYAWEMAAIVYCGQKFMTGFEERYGLPVFYRVRRALLRQARQAMLVPIKAIQAMWS
jgi:hypothetical protein